MHPVLWALCLDSALLNDQATRAQCGKDAAIKMHEMEYRVFMVLIIVIISQLLWGSEGEDSSNICMAV